VLALGCDRAEPREQVGCDLVAVRVVLDPSGDTLHFVEVFRADAHCDAVARRAIPLFLQHPRLPRVTHDEVEPVVQAYGAE
jgi:hypothetical protein